MSGSQVYNGMTFRDEKELARYRELEKALFLVNYPEFIFREV